MSCCCSGRWCSASPSRPSANGLLLCRIEAADDEPSFFLKRERMARVVVPTAELCASRKSRSVSSAHLVSPAGTDRDEARYRALGGATATAHGCRRGARPPLDGRRTEAQSKDARGDARNNIAALHRPAELVLGFRSSSPTAILSTLDQDGVWSVHHRHRLARRHRHGQVPQRPVIRRPRRHVRHRDGRDILGLPFTVGKSREMTVAQLMTPSDALVTGTESSTLDQCIAAMRAGVFRHLPIVEKRGGAVRGDLDPRRGAARGGHAKAPDRVGAHRRRDDGGAGRQGLRRGRRGRRRRRRGDADALDARAGSVLVMGGGSYDDESLVRLGGHLADLLERDYLTKVAVYDDARRRAAGGGGDDAGRCARCRARARRRPRSWWRATSAPR